MRHQRPDPPFSIERARSRSSAGYRPATLPLDSLVGSLAACPIPSLRWREMDSNPRSPAEFGNFDISRKVLVAGKMTFGGDDLTTRQRRTPRKRRSALDPFWRSIRTRILSCAPATTHTLNGTSPPREAHSRSVETIDRARPRANSSSRPCATFTTSPVDRWAGRKRTYPDHDDRLH